MSQKYPVTKQEMDAIAKTLGLSEYVESAMTRVALIKRLGFDATMEMYKRELPRRHPVDEAQDIERKIDETLKDWRNVPEPSAEYKARQAEIAKEDRAEKLTLKPYKSSGHKSAPLEPEEVDYDNVFFQG